MERILGRASVLSTSLSCSQRFFYKDLLKLSRKFGSCCCPNSNTSTLGSRIPYLVERGVLLRQLYRRKEGSSAFGLGFQQSVPVVRNSLTTTSTRSFASLPQEPSSSPSPLPPRNPKSNIEKKSPITWKNLFIIGGVAGLVLLGMQYVKKEKEEVQKKAQYRKMGKAKLGGDWTLVDHNGKLRSSTDFRGQWLLIYFGFTNCPDICPEEIEKIVEVIGMADADKDLPKIQPILITVDPTRDTPEALKEYCAEFSPRILGFSGTEEQINVATRAYRVYYSAGPKDEDNDYIVDHSIISYLVSPEGEFVEYFGQNKKVKEIYGTMKLNILSYKKKNAQ